MFIDGNKSVERKKKARGEKGDNCRGKVHEEVKVAVSIA